MQVLPRAESGKDSSVKGLLITLLLLMSLVLLSGCDTGQTPVPEATEEEISQSPLATPTTEIEPSPTPTEEVQVVEVPSPSPDTGVVTGILLRGDPPEAPKVAILYLGRILTADDGTPVMAGVDKQIAPKSGVDSTGRFAFSDVPPGQYALVLDAISRTLILRNPTDATDLLIDVTAGEVTDLGKLTYPDMPPLP
jgi:hypothetical protein